MDDPEVLAVVAVVKTQEVPHQVEQETLHLQVQLKVQMAEPVDKHQLIEVLVAVAVLALLVKMLTQQVVMAEPAHLQLEQVLLGVMEHQVQ
jgi:hypothetical protein